MHALIVLAALAPLPDFGPNPGALAGYEYVPDGLPQGSPLVVVLHGCTQTAAAMQSAGWNALADEEKFAVLYPEQQTANNPVRCFNWAGENGDTANLVRGQGENASIIEMVDKMIALHGSDPQRVYVTGVSAGAAFSAVMLATYPDRFAAGSIMSGIAYRCATDLSGAYSCQSPGVTKTAAQWGALAKMGDPGFSGASPRVQIWQGASDTTVAPANAVELVKQWTNVRGASETAESSEMIGAATHTRYAGGAVELYEVAGMQHGIAIGGAGCPATAGAYFLDVGLCSTTIAAQFFGLGSGGGGSGGDAGGGGGGGGGGDAGGDGGGDTAHDSGCSAGGGAGIATGLAMLAMRRRRSKRSRRTRG